MSARPTQPATGTIALADQLIRLRERVPLSEADIRRATGAKSRPIRAWLCRQEAPAGVEANRLCELMAIVKLLDPALEPTKLLTWLRTKLVELRGEAPLAALAAGNYEQVRAVALTLVGGPSA